MEGSSISLEYIEPSEVAKILRKEDESAGSYVILDVRDDDEYSEGHVKGAKSLPSDEWVESDFVEEVVKSHIDRDTIIVHCFYSKVRGPTCARTLVESLEAHLMQSPREKVPKV